MAPLDASTGSALGVLDSGIWISKVQHAEPFGRLRGGLVEARHKVWPIPLGSVHGLPHPQSPPRPFTFPRPLA